MFTHYGNMFTGGQRMMGGSPFGIDGFALLPLIGFIVLVAIVAAVVIWAVARKRPTTSATPGVMAAATAPASSGDAALGIARERLARGEIEPEQYTAIVNALNSQPTAQPSQG